MDDILQKYGKCSGPPEVENNLAQKTLDFLKKQNCTLTKKKKGKN
jgi:hypothetical protein